MIQPARFPNGLEVRAVTELRAAGRKLHGLAAPYNSPASIGSYVETIKPGAMRASLAAGKDVLALLDHDPTRLLARSSNGTLRLTETDQGLSFELDAPDTQLGRDAVTMAEAGLLGGVSIGFRVAKGGDVWPTPTTRHLLAVDLVELSLIQAFPAYGATSVQARFRAASFDTARVRRALIASL